MSPHTRQRVPSEDLRRTLEPVLAEHFRSTCRIRRLRRRVSAYSSSCPIENLELELDGGARLRFAFKDLSPASLLPTARDVRPAFLYDPRREIEAYRAGLDSTRLGTPAFYGAVVAAARGRYWLFLERVAGPLLWQIGRLEEWQRAARWLAALHTRFPAGSTSPADGRRSLFLRYDEAFYRNWLQRAEAHLRHARVPASRAQHRRFLTLASRYDRVIRRLSELPRTFIHGEFFPSNVILRPAGHPRRICPIDWELAAWAPGLIDLAALTAGEWSPDDRRKMIAAYRERWEPARGGRTPLAELVDAVTWCQLHLAVQFLGWAPDWSPPELHAQDWLREALRLAEQLDL